MNNGVYPQSVATRTDDDLMLDLANGHQEALGPLYSRYARVIFHLAEQSLERSAAEEVVQEVFLAVWRSAPTFDPAQGPFRPWLMQVAHWKVLNELRRRRRRPSEQYAEDDLFGAVADREPGPEELAWQHEHGNILHSALDALPAKQRQAVSMAFLQEMTHEQVAHALDVPLGTAKTRIRSGLMSLRGHLAPLAASLLTLAVAVIGVRYAQVQTDYQRDERALSLATISEVVPLRLTPVSSEVPAGAHANYRGRTGNSLAIVSTEALPAGQEYTVFVRHGESWLPIGSVSPAPDGTARLIAENQALSTPPDAVEIRAANGAAVLAWQTP